MEKLREDCFMKFSPIKSSDVIVDKYKRYLSTIFKISDEDYEKQFVKALAEKDMLAKGPYLDAVDTFKKGKSLSSLMDEGVVSKEMKKLNFPLDRSLYLHQEKAIRKALEGKNIVVSTGTGSGKTESFLLPILSELSNEIDKGTLCPGVRALLIYPMNALANDQIERLRELLDEFPEITYGSYTGQTQKKYEDALRDYKNLNDNRVPKENELISREQMIKTPPHILITNYAMLEFLMVRPQEAVFFKGSRAQYWKYVVLDEAHVYKGSTGIEVSMLLRRVASSLPVSKLQYVLTSATLGDESQNKEVAEFASRLCDSEFDENSVIRAIRQKPGEEEGIEFKNDWSSYAKLAEAIGDENHERICEEFKKLSGVEAKENSVQSELYNYLLKDQNYWDVRKALIEKPLTVYHLAKKLSCQEQDIVNLVTLASYAIKEQGQLLDAKYHMFVKATDSAFITLQPSKKLMLTRNNKIFDKGEEYAVFEAAVCSYCHDIYLVGKLDDAGYFKQSGLETGLGQNTSLYLGETISDEVDLEDEKNEVEEMKLCPHCGKLMHKKASASERCEHDPQKYVTVFNLNKPIESVGTCISCGNTSNVSGVARQFFTGQEAVTSVIGTALFEELPSYKTVYETIDIQDEDSFDFDDVVERKQDKEETAKQFIAFSDSRQAAAYFASYFSETYEGILYRRLIIEALKARGEATSLTHFAKDLTAAIENNHIIDPLDKEKESKKEAWKAILAELINLNSGSALQNLGLLKIDVDNALIPAAKAWGLTKEEMIDISNVLLMSMMIDAAIKYPVALDAEDKEFFLHNGHEGEFNYSDSSRSKKMKSFIPTRKNSKNRRWDYVERLFAKIGCDKDIDKFLEIFWKKVFGDQEIIKKNDKGYQVNAEKLNIVPKSTFYKCPKCRKITPYNVHGVCPTYRCTGELKEIDIEKEFADNHYYRMYHDMEIRKLRVVEHTAQLDKEKAYDYQKKFKNKQIDVLSCSTTFEMGVDVGTLETVLMRNMPPSPANYAQRAGRAGRSIKSSAYALTFCTKGNHDFSYFSEPESMIRGRINPPVFKVENEKIAIRHLYASAFAFFWKIHSQYFKSISVFMNKAEGEQETGLEKFENYLEGKPANLKEYLQSFLPEVLVQKFRVNDFGWVDSLIGENGALTKAVQEYEDELAKLDYSLKQAQEGNGGNEAYIRMRKNVFEEESILTFLSRKNVMPKYGFPVDTVGLSIYETGKSKNKNKDTTYHLDLSRDLSMAISEYAPGSQVVADGKLITSRYIRKIPNLGWKLYDYVTCDCKTLNIDQHIDYKDPDHLSICHTCGSELRQDLIRTFIVPEFGFEANKVEKATLIKPKRTYNSEIAYVGFRDDIETMPFVAGNRKYEMQFSSNDEMAVLNQSNFMVCESCGYAEVNSDNNQLKRTQEKEHHASNGALCQNKKLKRFSLGYRFQTDVMQIKFCWPELRKYDQALSVLYAIMRGACNVLNIEQSDIAGTIQYFKNKDTNHGCYKIILYDDTPGGAGHVKRLYDGDLFEKVLKEAYRIVDKCNCGGELKDTSCYSCLRMYANQRYHNILERRFVIDFLDKVFDEMLPAYVAGEDEEEGEEFDLSGFAEKHEEGTWEEIEELLQFSDQDVRSFAELVKNAGIDTPDTVGYEITDDDKVIAEAELVWKAKKIAYLSYEQKKYAEKLAHLGWTVFDDEHPFRADVF